MRIVFIGSVLFSYYTLEKLIDLQAEIVGVCTKENSPFNSDFKSLFPLCKQYNIPCIEVESLNTQESFKWIQSKKPDIIFCFGWSSLLKKELLELPPMGVVGFHPTALPQNRGRHPLIWALVLGLKQSASTFFIMDEGTDSGAILSQQTFPIDYHDNAQSLYDKVTKIALSQIESFLPKLQTKTYQLFPQEDSLANSWRKRTQFDGIIDFRMGSYAIYNLVRALSKPYSGASLRYKDKLISVFKVEEIKVDLPHIEYGKVLKVNQNEVVVKCYDNAIKIVEHNFTTLPKVGEYL